MVDHFMNATELTSFAGGALAAWVITNGIRVFLGFDRKWLILVVSIVIVFLFAGWVRQETAIAQVQQIFLALVNSLLLAFAAVGLNETIARGSEAPKAIAHGQEKQSWIRSWF
jgi:hypothetical protein